MKDVRVDLDDFETVDIGSNANMITMKFSIQRTGEYGHDIQTTTGVAREIARLLNEFADEVDRDARVEK